VPLNGRWLPGHDFTCAFRLASTRHEEPVMTRYLAPLGFALGAVWVAYLFFLVS
jgi:hypothetical protein